MRIYLQKPSEGNLPHRYCHLWTQEDLLHGWTLIAEAGYQGSRGRVKKQQYPDRESVEHALIAARDGHLRRGYRVMIVEGQSPSEKS
ncbi:MAG: hypothetical protein A2V90_03695 [Gammaproteobacteria bacterium RBG_16_57_12]|nr:MAG: hypothetical protein A2V90_03695 [Gammaproteobacteria bacterium RBG_16_57_12]